MLTSRPVTRWLAPVAAGLAVVAGGAAIGLITAAADHTRPPRTASQLLVDLQTARIDGLSGTVVARADLGLPALPGADGSPGLSAMLAGTHTIRLWYAAPDQARIALVGTLGETDVIRNGTDQWIWSSNDHTAVHQTIAGTRGGAGPVPTALPGPDPKQFADLALSALGPSTEISTSGPITVAGRDAYELIVSPKDLASRIGSVRVAIDADQHIPLRLQVFGRGSDAAAVEVAFTKISFARPDPAEFAFNPPPGTVTVESGAATPGPAREATPANRFALVGSGWTSVLVVRVPAEAASGWLAAMLSTLPKVSGGWGSGRLLTGTLFSVLLTDDGRLLAGAVGPEQLYRAAADPAARI